MMLHACYLFTQTQVISHLLEIFWLNTIIFITLAQKSQSPPPVLQKIFLYPQSVPKKH